MRRLLVLAFVLPFFFTTHSDAQSAGQQLLQDANAALDGADFDGAISKYEDLIEKYPTESFIAGARLSLALAQISAGKATEALATLTKLSDPQTPADLKEQAVFYSGQAALTLAGQTPADQRKAAFAKALAFFSNYLQTYPQGTLRESALFSRAEVNFFLEDYVAQQKDLAQLLGDYPQSRSRLDYLYWSGRGYAAQSEKIADKDRAQASEIGKQALAAFDQIKETPEAVVAANDAELEATDLRFVLAQTDAEYEEVAADYRKILSRDQLIPLQEKVVSDMSKQIGQAAQAHDKAGYQALIDRRQRQQSRLALLKAGSDPAVDAMIHEAEALNHLKRYDEARIVLDFVKPFTTDANDKQRTSYLRILTYALQGATDQADAGLKQHLSDFPNDTNIQNLRYLIAEQLRTQKDYAGAEAQYRKSLADFPAGRFADQSTAGLGTVLMAQQKNDEAVAVLNDFLQKKPNAANAAEAHYNLGMALAALKKTDEAIVQFRLVAADPKAGPFQATAALQAGFTLLSAGKADDALAELKKVTSNFPGTDQAGVALFYQGVALDSKHDTVAALAAYQQVVSDYPKQPVAPQAAEKIVRLYQAQNRNEEMIAAEHRVLTDFPTSQQAANVSLLVGQVLEKQRKYDEAAAEYQFVVDRPDSPIATLALARISAMWFSAARGLGAYSALNADEKKEWQDDTDKGEKAALSALTRAPGSREAGAALEELVKLAIVKIDAGIWKVDEAASWFADQLTHAEAPTLKARFELARIGVIAQRGKRDEVPTLYAKAEQDYPNPTLVYNPEDLERYGESLLRAKQYDAALVVYTKLKDNFPKEQRAQAGALYGLGSAQLASGKTAEADQAFDLLEKQYAWSDKIWEAKLGRGRAAEERGDTAGARAFYQQVVMSPSAAPASKARGLFGFAHTLETEGKLVENPQDKSAANAANNYLKIDALFDSAHEIAAEGLWRAGQVFERAQLPDKAKGAYQDLVKKYSDSPFSSQAQDRLKALGA